MSKLIQHSLESRDDCLKAMIDGQVFYYQGNTITYSDCMFFVTNPDRHKYPNFLASSYLRKCWNVWQVEDNSVNTIGGYQPHPNNCPDNCAPPPESE